MVSWLTSSRWLSRHITLVQAKRILGEAFFGCRSVTKRRAVILSACSFAKMSQSPLQTPHHRGRSVQPGNVHISHSCVLAQWHSSVRKTGTPLALSWACPMSQEVTHENNELRPGKSGTGCPLRPPGPPRSSQSQNRPPSRPVATQDAASQEEEERRSRGHGQGCVKQPCVPA